MIKVMTFVDGPGSGKSHAGAEKALAYCLANPGCWGIVTAPQNRVLEIATFPTYEKLFPDEINLPPQGDTITILGIGG